jgi:hypothetical protein
MENTPPHPPLGGGEISADVIWVKKYEKGHRKKRENVKKKGGVNFGISREGGKNIIFEGRGGVNMVFGPICRPLPGAVLFPHRQDLPPPLLHGGEDRYI